MTLLLKRILYSEGDFINQRPACLKFLKSSLFKIVTLFEDKAAKRKVKKQTKKKRVTIVESPDLSEEDSDPEASYSEVSQSESDDEKYDEARDGIHRPEISDSSDESGQSDREYESD